MVLAELLHRRGAATSVRGMTDAHALECQRCHRAVVINAAMYDAFDRMHWLCFHYEFEHDGDPDAACEDPSCPARAFDPSPRPTWTERLDT